jgi:saccharopine dehydrogenase (NAD+, L-lysine-forming)
MDPDVLPAPRFDNIAPGPSNVLLIGCGAVGSVVARHLSKSPAIGELLLADVDGDLAKRVALQTQGPKVHATQLDAGDEEALRRAMRGSRIVINTALPRFNPTIQRAARELGLHYLDPASETADPFVDTDQWKSSGLTAICGLGEDPGISNILGRHAADGMDRVESIKVRDGDTASSPDYPFIALFSPETFVEETLAASRIWRDGRYEAVPPFGAGETFEFPPPVGPLPVFSVDHEEVDTLPRFIGRGVQYVDFKLALDATTVQALKLFRDLHLLDRGPPGGPSPRKALFAALPKPADLAGRVEGHAIILVEVAGETNGERVVHSIHTMFGHREAFEKFGATATAYLTGSGMAAGAILLADGTIRERGKLSPESLDPKPFFPVFHGFGLRFDERIRRERSLN